MNDDTDKAKEEARKARAEMKKVEKELKQTQKAIDKSSGQQPASNASTADIIKGNYAK